MRQPVCPSSIVSASPPSFNATDSQLRGRQLIAARVIWVALAVTVVALNILALPGIHPLPVSPNILRDLHRLGISPTVFVIIYIPENAGYTLVYLTMGVLIFLRCSDDRMAIFCSLMLMTFCGVAANSLDDIIGGGPSPLPPQLVSFPLTKPSSQYISRSGCANPIATTIRARANSIAVNNPRPAEASATRL